MLVRPSYVLGGRAMVIAYDEESIIRYMKEAVEYSHDRPVLIDHFLEDAIEVDVDALSDGEDVVIGGIMQHIEEAGFTPATLVRAAGGRYSTAAAGTHARLHVQAGARAESCGPDEHSVRHPARKWQRRQWLEGGKVYVLEVNPRASRTVPFVSKATGVPHGKNCGATDDWPQAARVPCRNSSSAAPISTPEATTT